MADAELKTVKIECDECGGGYRNHEVVAKYELSGGNEDVGMYWHSAYEICKCRGCDSVRFRRSTSNSDDYDYETGEPDVTVRIYPEFRPNARQAHDMDGLPQRVEAIYHETIKAFNAGALTLAGGGLRAIVEAVCIEQKVTGKNLQQRIDQLALDGLLAKTQADLLHEERYIGNTALHEIERPAQRDIEDGLQIVESLLNTIYIAPLKAARLKQQRLKKAGMNHGESSSDSD